MNIKNESAAVSSATATLRQDVERLDVKMKEDIDNLKHECALYALSSEPDLLIVTIPGSKWSWTVERMNPRQISSNRISLLRYAVLHRYRVSSNTHVLHSGIVE